MMTILMKILQKKAKEVQQINRETFPTNEYKKVPTFYETIRVNHKMGVIAEIKRASPSKGMINEHVDPVQQAKLYEQHGASAISVLTDTPFFKGTMEDLQNVRAAVNIPILCKDFIIDEIQIDRAKAYGANIILLIAAALDDAHLKRLYDYAISLNLEVLCEVHNEEEMERVLQLNPRLVGVNNRDLKTFHVDLQTTNRLAKMVRNNDIIFISESGIETGADVAIVKDAGAEAILVGETLMRAANVANKMEEFQLPFEEKKGVK